MQKPLKPAMMTTSVETDGGERHGYRLRNFEALSCQRLLDQMYNMFRSAMDNSTTENGCPSFRTTGDPRVDLFSKLVRGLRREELMAHVERLVSGQDPAMCIDAFALWANTRDIRGGKGERTLSEWMFMALENHFPETVAAMVPLIPEYGSWRDVFAILAAKDTPLNLAVSLKELAVVQLRKDISSDRPSLCGKWAPRPKSKQKGIATDLAQALYPEAQHPLPLYREMLSALDRQLGTVEVAMSANAWASIKPASVPARCLKLHRAAFMNTNKKPRLDREECAIRFKAHALLAVSDPSKARLHGRVLHPHEMVQQYMGRALADDLILEAQWVNPRESVRQEMPHLAKMVPLCDVSGSMTGTPMQVAIALSVLISEVGAIRDRFITFSADPEWHTMQREWSLRQKVRNAMQAKWGMNTDFQKAIELILNACIAGNVPPEEIGELSLVVLSDMQFDSATQQWDTQYARLTKSFARAGKQSKWKRPYPVPRVVFWNLRGDTRDFPVRADTPGVDCVSGFSASLLKLFMSGAPTEQCTPYETMRKAIDDPRYQRVREVCAEVGEGCMRQVVHPIFNTTA